MIRDLDILLLSMPVRAIDRPSLSLPVLTSYLRKKGVKVSQMDNNVILQDELIEVEELENLMTTILPLLYRFNAVSDINSKKIRAFYDLLVTIDKSCGFKRLVEIKRLMQNGEFDYLTSKDNVQIVEYIFKLSANFKYYFKTVTYYYDYYLENNIDEGISRSMSILFKEIQNAKPLMVGFSVIEVQRGFSMWAAKKLRQQYDGYIMFGGSDVALNSESYLLENKSIDFACWSDGEETVIKLLNAIKDNRQEYKIIPNLTYRDGDEVITTEYKEFPIESFSIPDYEGIEMGKYIFSSVQILTSKGCQWSKCMFCMHWNSYGQNFRQRTVESVVDEIEYCIEHFGVRLFSIVDEAISADYSVTLSDEIIKRNLDIRWIQMSRLDSDFNSYTFEKLHQAGCRFIEWGLETGSQKVLDDMRKGINVREAQRIIHESAACGIVNKMLMFHNYPTESVEDLLKSIDIIRKNTYMRLLKPMLALRHSFVLKHGSPLSEIAFNDCGAKETYFKKVWKSDSVYNVNAKYIGALNNNKIKKRLISDYLNEMKTYLKANDVLITNNDNITMDLVLVQLIEEGFKVPVDVYLPLDSMKNLESDVLCC